VDKDFLTIEELSEYLGTKRSTLYRRVGRREIPFYRFGRLIRFKRADIEPWMEAFPNEAIDSDHGGGKLIRGAKRGGVDVGGIVKKNIEEVADLKYTPKYGKPDQIRSLRREVKDGTL
jgi:excisionase family DNA binding protein